MEAGHFHHYIIIRDDLERGPYGAQLGHAAARSANGLHSEGTHIVVLAAKSELELWDLSSRLSADQIPHVLITEPDAPFNGAATALGIQPMFQRDLRKYLKRFRCIR